MQVRPHNAAVGPEGAVWLGALDRETMAGVQRWSGGALSGYLPWPATYRESGALAGIFNGVPLSFAGDTLVAMYSGSDDLVLASTEGIMLDRLHIPHLRRRGVPEDVVEQLAEADGSTEIFATLSSARAVHQLPSTISRYCITIFPLKGAR